jgi:uncharacterized protein (TIGR00255 family)
MRQSMTGFAARQGDGAGFAWTWELRGVNGKGLDLRLRLPDWIEGLEAETRRRLQAALSRGNVQVSLKLVATSGTGTLTLDADQLDAVLAAMTRIEAAAMAEGLSLAPSTAAQIVGLRGVLAEPQGGADTAPLRAALLADLDAALAAFLAMRRSEGARLATVLDRQMSEIETLVAEADSAARARAPQQAERLRAQLARVLENTEADETRVAQELALIAVKSDVTEEIDRLRAHVAAARALLSEEGAVGRRFDFLAQEFNREANTLCSKSGDAALTRAGLALKTVIDQMREQVQNLE